MYSVQVYLVAPTQCCPGYKLHKMWKLSDHISSFCVVIISVTTICVMTEVLTPIVVFALPYLTTTQLQ